MKMKFSVGFAVMAMFMAVLAEPPVGNYLPPRFSAPSQNYGAPQKLSSTYGAPSNQFSSPASSFSRPSQSYGAPSQNYGAPSQSYGAPSQSYGAPHGGYSEEYNEPANYNFEYMVKDDHYGTDFGHKESRQGDKAHGEYYVLLPDGRKQIVRYEADEKGYRPMITYEHVGGGYGSGPSGYASNGGYSSGGPY